MQMRFMLKERDGQITLSLIIRDAIETIIKAADINFTRNILTVMSGDIGEKFIVRETNIEKFLIIGGLLIKENKMFYREKICS